MNRIVALWTEELAKDIEYCGDLAPRFHSPEITPSTLWVKLKSSLDEGMRRLEDAYKVLFLGYWVDPELD